jgi:hypothetical protein
MLYLFICLGFQGRLFPIECGPRIPQARDADWRIVRSYQLALPFMQYAVSSLRLQEKDRLAFIFYYNETIDVSMLGSSFIGDKKFRKYQHSLDEIAPSRGPTHPIHDPIQPVLSAFSRHFTATHVRSVGKLNRGLMPP